jgi:hypothetical protein
VWLEPEPALKPALDLAGPWQSVLADGLTSQPVTLPGKARGRCLVREVDLPAAWAGRSLYAHLEMPGQWLGSVVVNGHPINYNSYLHPYGLRADINLTPFAQPGRRNRVELWPFATIPPPGGNPRTEEADMEIGAVRIGCEAR